MTQEEFSNLQVGDLVAEVYRVYEMNEGSYATFVEQTSGKENAVHVSYGHVEDYRNKVMLDDLPIVKKLVEKYNESEAGADQLVKKVDELIEEKKALTDRKNMCEGEIENKQMIIERKEKEIEELKAQLLEERSMVSALKEELKYYHETQKKCSEDARASEWMKWSLEMTRILQKEKKEFPKP